jgi:uncharacterized protein (DUF2267 family)
VDNNAFIDSVARRSGTSPQQAEALTRATLRTLAERIGGGEARDLAVQLPEELRAYIFVPDESADRFGLDIFVERVSGRAEVDNPQAEAGVRAVFETLREAVTPGEYDEIISHLPAQFWEITEPMPRFDGGRGGPA